MTKLVLALVLSGMLVSAKPASSGQRQLFSLTIAAPQTKVRLGAQLRLLVTITNTSDRNIKIATSPGTLPEDWFRYKIDVRDTKGQSVPLSDRVRERDKRIGFFYGSTLAREIRPGGSFVDQVTVTRAYDLGSPGEYAISVSRALDGYGVSVQGAPPAAVKGGSVRSNTVTVTVID